MISEKHKFVFIHVPKTGGNSVQTCLLQYSESTKIFDGVDKNGVDHFDLKHSNFSYTKHSPLRVYEEDLGREVLRSYYVFTIIRNPWDWCASWFFHQDKHEYSKQNFKDFIQQMPALRDYITIEPVWVRELNRVFKRFGFMKRIYTKGIDGSVDFFIKFESLESDFNTVLKKLSLPESSLPHINKGSRNAYSQYYDEELRELVREKFREEIALGNYVFDRC
jgi:hypothetical protein